MMQGWFMKLLYGTGNPAKLNTMRKALAGLGLELIGLKDLSMQFDDVEEAGSDPLENSIIKARAYAKHVDLPVFSCDSGLYIEGLPQSEQPGVNVRTVGGKRLSDDEMIEHYSAIARRLGGSAVAQYRNAICLIAGGRMVTHFGADIASQRFVLTTVPHVKRIEGFPLDSLSVHLATGKYYYDLSRLEKGSTDEGFRNFFLRHINLLTECG
jgi:XTP/dITP diphosphohydrolase